MILKLQTSACFRSIKIEEQHKGKEIKHQG